MELMSPLVCLCRGASRCLAPVGSRLLPSTTTYDCDEGRREGERDGLRVGEREGRGGTEEEAGNIEKVGR